MSGGPIVSPQPNHASSDATSISPRAISVFLRKRRRSHRHRHSPLLAPVVAEASGRIALSPRPDPPTPPRAPTPTHLPHQILFFHPHSPPAVVFKPSPPPSPPPLDHRRIPSQKTMSRPTPASCKVVLAGTIASKLMVEVKKDLAKLGRKPLLVGFLANSDPAAKMYADWTGKTCTDKYALPPSSLFSFRPPNSHFWGMHQRLCLRPP